MSYTETDTEQRHFCNTCGELYGITTFTRGVPYSKVTRFHICQCREEHLAKFRKMCKAFWVAWDTKQDRDLLALFKEQNDC